MLERWEREGVAVRRGGEVVPRASLGGFLVLAAPPELPDNPLASTRVCNKLQLACDPSPTPASTLLDPSSPGSPLMTSLALPFPTAL